MDCIKEQCIYWPQIPQSHLTAFITAQTFGFLLYVLGLRLGLVICVLDSSPSLLVRGEAFIFTQHALVTKKN